MNSHQSSNRAKLGRASTSGNARSATSASPPKPGTRRKLSHHKVKTKTVKQIQQDQLSELGKQHQPDLSWLGGKVTTLKDLEDEIADYWEILTGRIELPVSNGVMSLQESATAIYVRAREIQSVLQENEYHGTLPRGSNLYRFRTGPVRNLIEAAAKAAE